jgi:hypothetical protein
MFWAYPCIHAHWTATCRSSAALTDERGAWEMRESSRASRCLRRQPRRCPRILSVDDCARRQPGLDNGSQVVVDAGRRPTHGLCADRQVSTGICRCFPAHCISQCDTVMETRFAQLGFSWATLEVMGHSLLPLSRHSRRPLHESSSSPESRLVPRSSTDSCSNVTQRPDPIQLLQRAVRWGSCCVSGGVPQPPSRRALRESYFSSQSTLATSSSVDSSSDRTQ